MKWLPHDCNELDKGNSYIDVLDDYRHEADEINLKNSWLNYTKEMHRLREFGYKSPLFDVSDQV